jgi:hypothetical protein
MKATYFGVVLAFAGITAVIAPAHADVKAVESIHIDSPQLNSMMQSMSPEQKKRMAAMGFTTDMVTTIYLSGNRQRTDFGPMSVFSDEGAHKVVMINRTTKTQTSMPTNSQAMKQRLAGSSATVKDTGKTTVILGHVAHLYKISMSNPAQGATTTGEIWAAPDIQSPRSSSVGSPMGGLNMAEMAKIKGFPLKFVMKTSGGYAGATTITGAIKSLSTTPLPGSTFTVPPGYHQGSPMFPGGGMGAPAH